MIEDNYSYILTTLIFLVGMLLGSIIGLVLGMVFLDLIDFGKLDVCFLGLGRNKKKEKS